MDIFFIMIDFYLPSPKDVFNCMYFLRLSDLKPFSCIDATYSGVTPVDFKAGNSFKGMSVKPSFLKPLIYSGVICNDFNGTRLRARMFLYPASSKPFTNSGVMPND